MPRGGARKGAGRPVGQGKYGEPTKNIRVPESMVDYIKFFSQNMTTSIPLYNFPVEDKKSFLAEDYSCGMYSLCELNIANPKDCFMAKFSGYSMKDAGILPNDLLLVDRKKEVSNGDIIVTAIKDGIVVKRLDKINGKLISENKDCKPIDITDQSDMHVWGVVIRVVREF